MIKTYFDKFLSEVMNSFGLMHQYKRDEINREIYQKACEEWEEGAEERKRRKKQDDEMPEPEYPEFNEIFYEPLEINCYLIKEFDEILHDLYTTDEDREREVKEAEALESARIEEEKRAEEKRKEEEAKKRGRKPPAAAQAAPEESPKDDQPEEPEEPENPYPEDCEGVMCIDLEAYIKNDEIIELVTGFRDRLFAHIFERHAAARSEAEEKDGQTLDTVKTEVGEKLNAHAPRKT
jgi:hypothetical protein